MEKEIVKTDVLCVGAGIAGLMAGIRASELGAKVVIIDKSENPIRSGCGGLGNDHFHCYIPEVHGPDIEPYIDEFHHSQVGSLRNRDFIRTWMERSFDMVKLWDSWGIPMKYNGKWEFAGHALPSKPLTWLHYAGLNQKKILVREAKKRGAWIEGRLTGYELLRDEEGKIAGAIAVHNKQPKAVVFESPAVILGTGVTSRLWPAPTPAYLFNTRLSPANTGDGRAMAYRAGAELVNMELEVIRCGPKYLSRAGKASFIGVCRDVDERPVGPFVTKPDIKHGDPIVDVYQGIFAEYARQGKGPIYMDCKGITDEEHGYMVHWMANEGLRSWMDEMKKEGLDFRKNSFEFWTYELFPRGGILYNEMTETSLSGLYAAGDEFFSSISGAAVFGWIAGENAASYVRNVSSASLYEVEQYVGERVEFLNDILARLNGAEWLESNIALQQLMNDYCGTLRSEKTLTAGLLYLRRLKDKVHKTLMARNQHELMRCIEVLNLVDLGELVMMGALERKESRGEHRRSDYPFTNRLLEKLLAIRMKDGHPALEWKGG
ncbi:FAD-binding protein [Chloroflexota bacterium]